MAQQQIVGIGGLGPDSLALFRFVTGLAGRPQPRVCLIPTAAADAPERTLAFYELSRDCGVIPSHLHLFNRQVADLRPFLLAHDVIFVGGGNTASMLAVWRAHGVDRILREAWEEGIVLAGPSAGANCWFEASVTDSFGPTLAPLLDGLGFLAGSFCPHYDSEAERRPTFTRLVAAGFPPGYAADDGVGLHFRGRELHEVVSARQDATAYRVEPGTEVALSMRLLQISGRSIDAALTPSQR